MRRSRSFSAACAVLFAALVGLGSTGCDRDGDFVIGRLISKGVVLQQNSKVVISGTAVPGTGIRIATDWDFSLYVTTPSDGRWSAVLATPPADNNRHTITFRSGNREQVVTDVLVGEVWFAAGQSNMRMPVTGWSSDSVCGGQRLIDEANDSLLRFFTIENQCGYEPFYDVQGKWKSLNKTNGKKFSATAYAFARALRDSLQVPVGIVQSTTGGSISRTWISRDNLKSFSDFDELDAKLSKGVDATNAYADWLNSMPSQFIVGPNGEDMLVDMSVNDTYMTLSSPDVSGWPKMTVPGFWEKQGLPEFDGVVWYAHRTTVPADWVGKDLRLILGSVDDRDVTYVNQLHVGSHQGADDFSVERDYLVPGKVVNSNMVDIAVRVTDVKSNGGLPGCSDGRPMRLALAADTAQWVDIQGEWSYCVAAQIVNSRLYSFGMPDNKFGTHPDVPLAVSQQEPTVVYNGMVAPLRGFTVAGALWHAGEGDLWNKSSRDVMQQSLPLIVKTFRQTFGNPELPVVVAQIAPSLYHGCHGYASGMVRIAQHAAVVELDDNVSLVSTLDLGMIGTTRPPFKIEEGRRMARLVLAKHYGFKGFIPCGPMPLSATTDHRIISVAFDYADGLYIDTDKASTFEVAGPDTVYYPAKALAAAKGITVFSHMVPDPLFVRYARGNCSEPILWNSAGLPAPSFEFKAEPVQ